eukprot:FR736447.1.p2 GENE.FR736447.1~~FR736447.1.p2  ORF type:complete len:132 (-),score=0.50 FR736447.1:338-733(-)
MLASLLASLAQSPAGQERQTDSHKLTWVQQAHIAKHVYVAVVYVPDVEWNLRSSAVNLISRKAALHAVMTAHSNLGTNFVRAHPASLIPLPSEVHGQAVDPRTQAVVPMAEIFKGRHPAASSVGLTMSCVP